MEALSYCDLSNWAPASAGVVPTGRQFTYSPAHSFSSVYAIA
ncbi:hypothetical protein SAMN05428984_2062 [Sphingomonas sp. OK281]|nr:hypothetical protein SAMN05428984_2062 [Sphingomonas sp. OK281]